MKQSERMAVNIGVTFLRMVTTVGMGLYATRLLVQSLGEVDFGLYGLLGGGAAMLMLVSATLTMSAQRHLAYEMGLEKSDGEELNAIFSTIVLIFIAVAILLVLVGVIVTPLLMSYLDYPHERETAVLSFWGTTLLMTGTVLLICPYYALFTARQAMVQEALFGVFSSTFRLVLILVVSSYGGDRLILLGFLMLLHKGCELLLMSRFARWRFPEAHTKFRLVRRDLLKELLVFGGWGFLDALALRLRQLGGNLILNPFFGPAVNAAYTVGCQAQTYQYSLAWTFVRATNPVIVQRYSSGDLVFMRRLILSVCRMSTLFLAAACIPAILEMDYGLEVWLGRKLPYAADFCRLMLFTVLAEQLTCGYTSGIQAYGKLAIFNSVTATATLAPIALATLLFYYDYGEPSMLVQLILAGICCDILFRVLYVGRILGIPFRHWALGVFGRVGITIGVSSACAYGMREWYGPASFLRLTATFAVYFAVFTPCVWLIGMGKDEKDKLLSWGSKIFRRPVL